MDMKSLNKLTKHLNDNNFDILFESHMVQSRIISSILNAIEFKKLTQQDLEKLTGLSQPFLSALFNNRRKLNVEHIAKLQNALGIIFQPPTYLLNEHHLNEYYNEEQYIGFKSVSEFKKREIFYQMDDLLKFHKAFQLDNLSTTETLEPNNSNYEFA